MPLKVSLPVLAVSDEMLLHDHGRTLVVCEGHKSQQIAHDDFLTHNHAISPKSVAPAKSSAVRHPPSNICCLLSNVE